MDNRKSLVISESAILITNACQGMIALALGDRSSLKDAVVKFTKHETFKSPEGDGLHYHRERFGLEIQMRVRNNQNREEVLQKWLAVFFIAKNIDNEWILSRSHFMTMQNGNKRHIFQINEFQDFHLVEI